MADLGFGSLIRLGRAEVQRARKLEVVERSTRKLLEPAAGAPHPVHSRTVRERHLHAEARVHAVPSAFDAHAPTARRDDADPDPSSSELRCYLLAAHRSGTVDEHEGRDGFVDGIV